MPPDEQHPDQPSLDEVRHFSSRRKLYILGPIAVAALAVAVFLALQVIMPPESKAPQASASTAPTSEATTSPTTSSPAASATPRIGNRSVPVPAVGDEGVDSADVQHFQDASITDDRADDSCMQWNSYDNLPDVWYSEGVYQGQDVRTRLAKLTPDKAATVKEALESPDSMCQDTEPDFTSGKLLTAFPAEGGDAGIFYEVTIPDEGWYMHLVTLSDGYLLDIWGPLHALGSKPRYEPYAKLAITKADELVGTHFGRT